MLDALILLGLMFFFGPAVGASFCLARGLSPVETAIITSALHLLLVPVWFWLLSVFKYEALYRRRILKRLGVGEELLARANALVSETIKKFEQNRKRWTLGSGIFVFTFLMGVSWAALVSTVLNISPSTIFPSVAAGAVVSSLFWTGALSGVAPFLPEPWLIFLVTGVLTLGLFAHGKVKETRTVGELSKTLKRLSTQMERFPLLLKKK
jgi:uncharacterized membrane protein